MSALRFGKYHIKRELGRGAMGVVYEAQDVEIGLEVALKVMTVPAGATPEATRNRLERFYREARALKGLLHPNIVRLFDEGEVGRRFFFSMELVRGTTLRDRIQMQGPLPVSDLLRLATELCDALDHVHDRGVVHRDLKPENVMLLPDGSAKLMDFGVAWLAAEDDPSRSNGFHGSPCYMSPEQAASRAVDGRSDLYSLAVTLYEAATGRRAVEGDSIPAITHKVLSEYPPPPPGLPVYFQAALLRAMAKDPAARYGRAGEMAADLRAGRIPAPLPPPSLPAVPPGYLLSAPTPGGFAGPTAPAPVSFSSPGGAPAGPAATVLIPTYPPAPVQPGTETASDEAWTQCRVHPRRPSVETCGQCGHPVCYLCLLEVPVRGILCRACAFMNR